MPVTPFHTGDMSGSPTDLEFGVFSDTPPWDLDPATTAWGGDVTALRAATARRLSLIHI